MCLKLTNPELQIATTDIVVYKHIVKTKYIGKAEYRTAYQYCLVEIGKLYRSKLELFVNEIHIGLHSFCELSAAKQEAKLNNEVLVKCIIPKGSKYYIGVFKRYKSIASNKLKYIEVIKDFTSQY